MIRGLQMVINGKDLKTRIGERIRINEAAVAALDARLLERAGDAPFDVRLEDGLKTLEEVTADRDRLRDRVTQLTMMRDGIAEGQSYTLNRRDLRAADLISHDGRNRASDDSEGWVDAPTRAPIQGLKLTFSGIELRALLDARCEVHRQRAVHWQKERERTPEDATEDEPLLPDHMCENEAEESEWRAEVLGFIPTTLTSTRRIAWPRPTSRSASSFPRSPAGCSSQSTRNGQEWRSASAASQAVRAPWSLGFLSAAGRRGP